MACGEAADRREREQWRLLHILGSELRALQERLADLLPPAVAARHLAGPAGGGGVCEPCTAAVLQLDICNFTAMSQALPPLEVRFRRLSPR